MKFKTFIKKNATEVTISIIGVFMVGLLAFLIGFAINESNKEKEYFNNLTPEQQQEYLQKQEEKKEANIQKYEVLGTFRYIRTKTNQYGGITDRDICYAFEYVDASGNFHSVEDFQHLEHGLTKVIVGDENLYIIDTNGVDTYRYLQLTKETLKNMENK